MMIHELLELARPLFTFDCETTGVDVAVDRIIQIGFERWDAGGKNLEWKTLINPGVPIPPAAMAIHHITDRMVQGCRKCGELNDIMHAGKDHPFDGWPTFREIAPGLAKGFSNCDFAGKNVRFDLRITDAEMQRSDVPWSYSGARIIDAERLEQIAVPRKLSDLYEKYTGEKFEGAHDALADVKASTVIIAHQLEAHAGLPRDLDALHAAQWPGWIDGDGKFRFVDGVACFGMWGKHAGKPMRTAERGYWDWVISSRFPEDVKKLAANAKLGKFPEAK